MASGGYPTKTSDEAVKSLWNFDMFGGGKFGRFHVVRANDDTSSIIGASYSSWFDRKMRLDTIAVDPNYRGNGIGARVIKTLADVAVRRNVEQIWLFANPDENLLQFYKKLGFRESSPSETYIDHSTESRYVPLTANISAITEKPIDPLPTAGVIV